jgi:polar amino acid transport system substrate-binding protein
MKLIRIFAIGIILLLFSSMSFAMSEKKIVFTAPDSTGATNAYLQFLQKAYGELGYEVTLKEYPLKRGYQSVDSGEIDGVLMTSASILEAFKNIRMVKPPLTKIDLVVYTVNKDFKVAGRDSIKPYKIGILRGYPLSTKITTGLDRQEMNDSKALFSVLQVGRIDIALAMRRETERFFKQSPGFEDIKALSPPIYSLPLYHFLNAKHEALIPKVTPIMERLFAEGLLTKLYEPYAQ